MHITTDERLFYFKNLINSKFANRAAENTYFLVSFGPQKRWLFPIIDVCPQILNHTIAVLLYYKICIQRYEDYRISNASQGLQTNICDGDNASTALALLQFY